LLLLIFVLGYVQWAIRRQPAQEQIVTRWIMRATVWGGINVLVTAIAGITDYPPLDLAQHVRVLCALLLFHALIRAFYALPPTHDFGHPGEARYVPRLILLAAGMEALYTGYRFWSFGQTGLISVRPLWGELPLILAALTVLLLLVRKLWAAEAEAGLSVQQHLGRILTSPQSRVGSLYRWFLLVILGLIAVMLLIIGFSTRLIPVWVMVATDLLAMASLLSLTIVYLRYQFIAVGMEMRVVGGALAIFLGLISGLGWLLSLTFLGQEAPGVPISDLVGSQLRLKFQPPPAYAGVLAQLSALLLPVLWFQILGSLALTFFFALYYRRTVTAALEQMAQGLAQIEQGHLAYRLSPPPWQDELRQIVDSFNHMARSLERSQQEVKAYQQNLEDMVERRTAQLIHEIELRKNLELHQGIQEERTRIARETHDGLLQTLLGVRIRLNRGKRLSRETTPHIEEEMTELAVEVTQAAQDLRNLINDLSAEILADGLLSALGQVIQRQQANYDLPIHTELDYPKDLLPPAQELNLLRIMQEALTNLCRHSGADQAWVSMKVEQVGGEPALLVEVRDNGSGFDPLHPAGSGWGIRNMQHRAEQLGATLSIHSQPGQGSTVKLILGKGAPST
jgi:signal transduction histidine kinase